MKPPQGLRQGAIELLDKYRESQLAVAEAFLKDEIPHQLLGFVWDVIDGAHVEKVKNRLNRESWGLVHRVKQLEEEVRELRANAPPRRPPPTRSPYEPRRLPR